MWVILMPPPDPASDPKVCPLCNDNFTSDKRFCPRDGSALVVLRPSHDLEGRVIDGRFFVTRKLGEGGMGSVYLAEQVRIQRDCALKVIKDRSMLDPEAIVRFSREAKNASKISHTNVATIYEFGEFEDGLVYMAMEYVDGEPLSTLLSRETALPPRRAASIAGQIAEALVAAHEHDIVHRDLKPENVMLAKRRGGGDLVKVVDFGIARLTGAESQVVTLTGASSGTPRYMSPEQLLGGEVDARSDIYALGLISFVMLVGRQPWDSDEFESQPVVRIGGRARTLHEHKPQCDWPEELQAVLNKALALDPADRYENASEFGEDIKSAITRWIPDDDAAQVPWNVSLRFHSTPRGVRRYTPGVAQTAVRVPNVSAQVNTTAQRTAAVPAEHTDRRRASRFGWPAKTLPLAALVVAGLLIAKSALDWGTAPLGGSPDSARPSQKDSVAIPNAISGTSKGSERGSATSQRGESLSVRAPRSAADSGAMGAAGVVNTVMTLSGLALSPEEGKLVLARLKRLADATAANAESARTALNVAQQTLPHLTSAADSVEAQYYVAEAHLILDNVRAACRSLTAIEPASRNGPFAKAVAMLLADRDLGCR